MTTKEYKTYKNSLDHYLFSNLLTHRFQNGKENPLYYETLIDNWYKQRYSELLKNNNLKIRIEILNDYLIDLKELLISFIEFYAKIHRCESVKSERINIVNIKKYQLKKQLNKIEEIIISIQLTDEKGEKELANKLLDFVFYKFDEVISVLKINFHIDLLKSPLKKDIKTAKKKIKNSLVRNHKQKVGNWENPYNEIFIDTMGYKIFKKYMENHIVNDFLDLSYLYHRLNDDKRIYRIKQIPFGAWLKEENFINEKVLEKIISKKGFEKKSDSIERVNKYNVIEKELNN